MVAEVFEKIEGFQYIKSVDACANLSACTNLSPAECTQFEMQVNLTNYPMATFNSGKTIHKRKFKSQQKQHKKGEESGMF